MRNNTTTTKRALVAITICLLATALTIYTGVGYAQQNNNSARAATFNELYEIIKANANADNEQNRQRIRTFTERREQQRALLQQEQQAVAEQEALSKELNGIINNNERALADLEKQLTEKLGNFGELFGVTRQVAADTRAQIATSFISAEFPGREQVLTDISASKALPTIEQLRELWLVLLREQMEQGRLARFNATINDEVGLPQTAAVIRVGPFAAMAAGKFLNYSEESGLLSMLKRQPSTIYLRSARELEQAQPQQTIDVVVDPSRGSILGMLVEEPNLIEWFHQGKLPGYVVTVLAVIGLAIGFQRLISLWIVGIKVRRQMRDDEAHLSNPLGRVIAAYHSNPSADTETLELKLDDAVLKEVPKLDRGLSTLKVLAAVAPLLGLLGTVVGMILTFQSITLWGTGEPKLMAAGISQALVTTVQGLVAAIPLLLLHNLANSRARTIQQILEEQSAGFVAAQAEARSGTEVAYG